MTVHFSSLPAILEPHFDLLLFNVGKDGALPNELLPSRRTRLGALRIHPLQSLHLFRCVPHILATIHETVQYWISLHTKCHKNNKAKTFSDSKRHYFESSSSLPSSPREPIRRCTVNSPQNPNFEQGFKS